MEVLVKVCYGEVGVGELGRNFAVDVLNEHGDGNREVS